MDNNNGGAYVIAVNGKLRGIADDADTARKYAMRYCLDPEYKGAKFKWTDTHKLFAQRRRRPWAWIGIEIVPVPYV